jgi:hypothetical protein
MAAPLLRKLINKKSAVVGGVQAVEKFYLGAQRKTFLIHE